MKIEILRSTVCDGVMVAAGEVIEASDQDALVLLTMGKAKPAGKSAPESAAIVAPEKAVKQPAETAVIETPEKAVKQPAEKKPGGKKGTGKAVKDGAEDTTSG
jgi:hypothetical protein